MNSIGIQDERSYIEQAQVSLMSSLFTKRSSVSFKSKVIKKTHPQKLLQKIATKSLPKFLHLVAGCVPYSEFQVQPLYEKSEIV